MTKVKIDYTKIELELKQVKTQFGSITRANIVEFSRKEDTYLHTLFTCDESEASDKFLLIQANKLIDNVTRILSKKMGNPLVQNFVQNIQNNNNIQAKDDFGKLLDDGRQHIDYKTIINTPEFKIDRIKLAIRKLRTWIRNNQKYKDLDFIRTGLITLLEAYWDEDNNTLY